MLLSKFSDFISLTGIELTAPKSLNAKTTHQNENTKSEQQIGFGQLKNESIKSNKIKDSFDTSDSNLTFM